jgi:hypothetical protein
MMISGEPSLSRQGIVILLHDILVGCQNPCATFFEIDLDNAEPGRVTRAVVKEDTSGETKTRSCERFPIQVELEI